MTADLTPDQRDYDGYGRLRAEVARRWREPRSHPTFALYFVGSFLFFAAMGIWLEVARLGMDRGGSLGALRTAIATYFPAILGSCMLQLTISDSLRSLKALGQIIGWIFIVLAMILVFAATLEDWAAIVLGVVASAAALACWWIVNADDHSLRDEPLPPEVATGKPDPTAPLLGTGALNDFVS